ncbi:Syntaxin-12 [Yarrowia sp. C11]|nr:Syntaxin-12 [Yarrowia sp. E02]KAG5371797.1 Syntaxin-12 [Yarrowia sp. C11]
MDLENQKVPFPQVTTELSESLQTVSADVAKLDRFVSWIGTRKDGDTNRGRVTDLAEKITLDIKTMHGNVRRLNMFPEAELTSTEQFAQKRLSNEFGLLLSRFQNLQHQSTDAYKRQDTAARAALEEERSEQDRLLAAKPMANYGGLQDQLLDVVDQSEVDLQQVLISEREEDIRGIEQGINDINGIYRDLGALIAHQGEQMDSVENNISTVADQTSAAAGELVKANDYQKKRRTCSLIVLAIMIFALVIILAVAA